MTDRCSARCGYGRATGLDNRTAQNCQGIVAWGLEIGAGTGDQTLVLAQRVGPLGHVLATDLTEEMLTVARRRARAAGLDDITFRNADASKFDLGEGGFDAAVSGRSVTASSPLRVLEVTFASVVGSQRP